MRLVNQRSDIDMGHMPAQLIARSHQVTVGGPAAVRAAKDAAGRPVMPMAARAGRSRAALCSSDDFEMTSGLVLNLAGLLAVLPHPLALALGLAPWRFGNS